MKIRVITEDTWGGETDVEFHPKYAPLKEAFKETVWSEDWTFLQEKIEREARLNSNGEPYIKETCTKVPPKGWLDSGRNHRTDENRCYREMSYENWYIEVESLEQLLEIIRDNKVDIHFYAESPHTQEELPVIAVLD